MKSNVHLWRNLVQFFLEWKSFPTEMVKTKKTFYIEFIFFPENGSVYETLWKNIAEQDRLQKK
jgi:hypothetical protein